MDSEETKKTSGLRPPWKKGECGNPKGRPVGAKTGLRARLKRILDQEIPLDLIQELASKGVTLKDSDHAGLIAHLLKEMALKSDFQAIKLMFDETEPPLPKEIKLDGDLKVTKIERVIKNDNPTD